MKKLLLIGALALTSLISAQTTIFSADFSSAAGWSVADRDGDGNNWGIFNLTTPLNGFAVGQVAGSRSWSSTEGPLSPDNLLISPDIVLPTGGTLNFSVKVGSVDEDYFDDHYAIYAILSTAVFTGSETPLIENTLTSAEAVTVTADLSTLAGKTIKLVFRHFDSFDQNIFLMDDVLVTQTMLGASDSSINSGIRVYPNPTSDYINFTEKVKSVQIFDASGRKANFPQVVDNKLDVRNLAKGIYVIKFETEKGIQSLKFIKE
ncbi:MULTISPECIES: T9SS-dependent choice-of-anchor J family protein [Chryseobacterium]|uniref:Hemagglutinin A n=1 Tax=Chryseobacterium salivictor TaxID=2547600 RepID=A0A4P6ZH39_9FLAO|nr:MULTISPECIES: T9SS type A sorting domain-containing protein [Chryseobacterium]MDQ0475614.1 hypothetical protein [Chryseobacterium sp. MDT2-18]QBO59041.1 Hemagglutinin A [Chryseobacterium salivictor]